MINPVLLGGDTETYKGRPLTVQLFNEPYGIAEIIWVNEENVLEKFLKFFESLPANEYIVAIHNMKFDMVELFYPYLYELASNEFQIEVNGWKISGVYDKVYFVSMTKGATGKRTPRRKIFLMDTFLFFKTSLAKLAEIYCADLPKLEKPAYLGERRYTEKSKKFKNYAMRDAEIAYHVLVELDRRSKEFDLPVCVSAPHLASRIFRHRFMQQDIPLPPSNVIGACIQAYHGGKNSFVYPAGFYDNVRLADITSAYPFAMTELPSFYDTKCYKVYNCKGQPSSVPPYGVYKFRGFVEPCKYPIFFDRSFKPVFGESEVWVTGIEINEALDKGEIKINSLFGYFYDIEKDHYVSPLAEYANYFFKFKEMAKSKSADYEFYKLMMNSLYGKFIETRQKQKQFVWDCENDTLFEEALANVGNCFQPMIAALITAHTRSYVHHLEHEYDAIHTATDGIFTHKAVEPISGLGGLTCTKSGQLLVLRNKLYAFLINGKVEKYGLHAFRGKVDDMLKIFLTGDNTYRYIKPNTLKESLNRGLQVNLFEERTAKVNF